MARSKKRAELSGRFWRIFITAVGASLVLIAAAQLVLFFFGASAPADVSVRRQGGSDDGAAPNRRYAWSLDYTFTDGNGQTHSGSATRRGSDTSVQTDDRVYYLTFAPFVSALESDAAPGLSQPLYAALGVLLILVMNRKKRSTGKKRPASLGGVGPAGLDDYDDSAEELFTATMRNNEKT